MKFQPTIFPSWIPGQPLIQVLLGHCRQIG
jgi:hypothetical protein